MEWNEVIKQVLTIAGGTSVVVSGFAIFLGRIWVGRVLNNENVAHEAKLKNIQAQLDATSQRLKTDLEKGLHIHKIQFEKEFKIYEKLWSKLVELRKAALSLRPEFDTVDPKEPEGERKAKRLTRFGDAIADFVDITDKNRPFYAEAVYQSMETLWKLTHSEAVEYKHLDPYADSYWDRAQKNREKILTEIEKCSEIIRQRVGAIRVSD